MTTIRSVNPYTLQELAVYEPDTMTVWQSKIEMAANAQTVWRRRSMEERLFFIAKVGLILLAQKEELAKLITFEMGKRYAESVAEIEKCAALCKYYETADFNFLKGEKIATDARDSGFVYEPLGVILGIMPWNFPFWQAFRFIIPALLAGNTVLLKHASNVTACALAIEKLFAQSGLPIGCMQTLLLPGRDTLEVLANPHISAVSITGSETAGKQVASAAAALIKPAVLELGGSDPFIVFKDADLARAADIGLLSRFQNSGQSCIAAKRFIIHQQIYEDFIALLVNRTKSLKLGDPMLDETTQAPLARAEFVQDLEVQVRASIRAGAELRLGGEVWEQHSGFYKPTILANVTGSMPAAQEELFGPVAAIMSFEEPEEAIQLANSTRFGLGSTVFTFNEHLIQLSLNELQAGSVFVNGMMKSHPAIPFGGIKVSGYGRELGKAGVMAFCQMKSYWMQT